MTKPPTSPSPDEQLTRLHDGLAVLGLGELRRALDQALAEPVKDESRLAWSNFGARRRRRAPNSA